ncbi:hypothetical protein Pcinc_037709 [Petrolisthes cinctipes]|uniref:Uncharacterized protein n=1 Tax=Petrolisthes cinctipes TaxID=88211 RepID=A0AAE1BTH2_PETCI|nr:hypothetical protein Pcinc_037709 [Petrolisthes cinctipes]
MGLLCYKGQLAQGIGQPRQDKKARVVLLPLFAVFLVRGPTPLKRAQSTQELKGIFDQLKQQQDPTVPGLDGFIIVGTDFYYDQRTGQLTHTGQSDDGPGGGGAAVGEANAVEGTAQNEETGPEKPTKVPSQNAVEGVEGVANEPAQETSRNGEASEGVASGIETNQNGGEEKGATNEPKEKTGQTGRGR